MESIITLVNNYGYIIIFASLMLELIAFPLPGEVMMTYCGFLVYQSRLNFVLCITAAAAGAVTGITISYFIGTWLGEGLFRKYGSYIHMGTEKLDKASGWFKNYGKRLLLFAFFIPGIRHVTGYFSGITEIKYKKFAAYAYTGAFIWVTTFISLGRVLGPDWDKYHQSIKKYIIIGCIIFAIVLTAYYFFKDKRQQIQAYAFRALNIFHTKGRLRLAVTALSAAFLVLCALVMGIVQDYLANEYARFDEIGSYLVRHIFSEGWSNYMNFFNSLPGIKTIFPITTIMVIWIVIKKTDVLLEIRFLLTAVFGGEVLQFILLYIFRRPGPFSQGLIFTFPSHNSFMSLAAFGMVSYLLLRHTKNSKFKIAVVFITVIVCLFSGITPVYFGTEYPSDVYAGYIFGGVWLLLNIILLEINRILPS